MAEVIVLIEGYTSDDNKNGGICPTVTLVRSKNIVMIVDPGTVKNQKLLIEKLRENNLALGDVTFVCITHSHMDHYMNIGMFPNAKALDFWGLWYSDKFEKTKREFTRDIEIVKTPGHSDDSITLFVKTKEGVVAICGDVFWKENFPEKDHFANDIKKLEESRKIVKKADFIIPGHGNIFQVKK